VSHPGWTWTPITREDDPADRHDRIDMIITGPGVVTTSVAIVGERPDRADIVVRPYPSDHRAVVAVVQVQPPHPRGIQKTSDCHTHPRAQPKPRLTPS